MSEVLGDAMPWPHPHSSKESASTETTKGGRESTRWVAVGVNLNPGEAVVIKARLESQDIPAIVQQEAMGSVLGLTVGPMGSAKLLVPEPLAERALEILADTFEGEEEVDEDYDDEAHQP